MANLAIKIIERKPINDATNHGKNVIGTSESKSWRTDDNIESGAAK
jgi:hypothetical protein